MSSRNPITGDPVKAVVFDLGGVLLELRDPIENFQLCMPEAEFLGRWLLSPSVRAFERGVIDAQSFARSIVEEMELPMDWPDFLERFDAWPLSLFPDTLALLDAIPSGIKRGLLSNTNANHWERTDISGGLTGRFDREFLSYQTRLLKPDQESFLQVPEGLGCLPRQILYFDDNPRNVTAAAATGMQAFMARSPADVRQVLLRYSLA
jgi:glucose-1-phosphatase